MANAPDTLVVTGPNLQQVAPESLLITPTGATGPVALGGLVRTYNTTATADPGVSNDSTQGYVPGSVWINTTASRVWMCQSNAAGAATWLLDGVIPGVGVEPSSMLTYFGGGTASFPEEGNIYRLASAGVNPASTGGNIVLAAFSLPAGSFDVANRGLNFTAMGSVANNTNVKTISIYYGCTTAVVGSAVTGGTVIASTGAYSTTGAAAWQLVANVFKYGAAASNTQIGLHETAQIGATIPALTVPQALTATESGAILIAVTGNAATTATDIALNLFAINAMN